MLKVKEVTKRYVSKKGNECDALQGVSFDLPYKGLYFILGKSGSGKSTLLNLLGGLDTCTSGEIILNGLNVTNMDTEQFDVYRNEYLGFIFQEFNLIENLSVGENVCLPLSLQDIKDCKGRAEKALEEVGLSGMSARFPDELSGGQKQRVAIARALVKNPRIILADEPTGNLDSETGEEIFDLLVNLSKSKLVIVVSHDQESAEKYGDGIIELQDGKIIRNTCPPSEEVKEEPARLKNYRSKLPDSVAFKMGFSNLLKKKMRSISCILIAVFTILAIALSQMILSYSPEYAIYRQVKKDGNSHIILQQGEKTYWGLTPNTIMGRILQSTMAHMKDEWGVEFVGQWDTDYVLVENEEEIVSAGYEFVGEHLPLDDNSFYISEAYLEELFEKLPAFRPYVYEDGEFVRLDESLHNKDNLVGKMMNLNLPSLFNCHVIAGIIATVSDKITPDNEYLMNNERAWNSAVNGKLFALRSMLVCNSAVISGPDFETTVTTSSEQINKSVSASSSSGLDKGEIYTADGVLYNTVLQLADNEVVLCYDIYKTLFPDAKDIIYYSLGNAPEHLNEEISLSVKESQTGYECKTYENLIIKGVYFAKEEYYGNGYTLILSPAKTTELYYDTHGCKSLTVDVSSVKDLYGFLKDVRQADVNAYVVNSSFFYEFEMTANQFGVVFIVLSCVLSVLLLLFVINLISVSIKNQQKDIGILRALGARSRDIFKIYIYESAFIAVIPLIVCLGGAFLMAWLVNKIFTAGVLTFSLVFVTWLTALIIIFASVVLIGIATVIPLNKIVKMRPIDAIKKL